MSEDAAVLAVWRVGDYRGELVYEGSGYFTVSGEGLVVEGDGLVGSGGGKFS